MTESTPPRGIPDVIAGRYQTVSVIGAGGMGTVYKAIDTRLNRAVAIKSLHQTRLRELGGGARLRAEALAAAALDHPFICKVYELVEEPDGTLIVMEYVEGETLAAILKRGLPPLGEVLQIGRDREEDQLAVVGVALGARRLRPVDHRERPLLRQRRGRPGRQGKTGRRSPCETHNPSHRSTPCRS